MLSYVVRCQYPFCASDESQYHNYWIRKYDTRWCQHSFSTPSSSFSLIHHFFVFLPNEHKLTNESDLTGSWWTHWDSWCPKTSPCSHPHRSPGSTACLGWSQRPGRTGHEHFRVCKLALCYGKKWQKPNLNFHKKKSCFSDRTQTCLQLLTQMERCLPHWTQIPSSYCAIIGRR